MMHKLPAALLFILLATSTNTMGQATINPDKILIVYLSRTGNTKVIAEIIQKQAGGKLIRLELKDPYPSDYKQQVDQVVKENEMDFLPPLKTRIDSIGKFDVVFVGFPTWDMKLPPPVKSFLRQYDLKGKTVVPFNTNAGYGAGSSFETIKQLCPDSKVLPGFTLTAGAEKDHQYLVIKGEKATEAERPVKKWLTGLHLASR